MLRRFRYNRQFPDLNLFPTLRTPFNGIIFLTLSARLKILLPPLFIASLPKRAIGFSFPRGRDGEAIGICLLALAFALSAILFPSLGAISLLLMFWLLGGTAIMMIYNCATQGMAFVKETCAGCRLLPIIEEHESVHLSGVASEEAVWSEARKKYSYESLGLEGDPRVCYFCPIAKRLKGN